ncbi:MAG: Sec-independent protein translocase protein TatB [Methylococcaceae bacterium]|nr:Sec-independent protein translocase protein TatB [Methylococcaceae bacterium]
MFDVGFSELLMVGLVALLVIGPEKLPKVARLAGFWLGKARGTVAGIKAEIKQELYAEDLRQQLAMNQVKQTLDDGVAAMMDIDSAMDAIATELRPSLDTDS